jgi:hypothetical protein
MASFVRHASRTLRWSIALGAAAFLVTLGVRTGEAHKSVTSKYDYDRDVFPLLRDHCGRCHVDGRVAPMSLLTYKEAVPWAESIRDELTTGRMPPWPMDPRSPAVKGMHPMSPCDVDVIVTWAAGGTPRDWSGDLDKQLPKVTLSTQWKLGQPDLVVAMRSEYTLGTNASDETKDFGIPLGITEVKWVRASDLLPETPVMVRDATISVENGPTLALWQPGSDPLSAPSGAAFRVAPGATLHLQIHYKKPYSQEQNALSDKSRIGLYFTDPPVSGRELQSVVASEKTASANRAASESQARLPSAGRVFALRPCSTRRTAASTSWPSRRAATDFAVGLHRTSPAVVPPVLAAGRSGSRRRLHRARFRLLVITQRDQASVGRFPLHVAVDTCRSRENQARKSLRVLDPVSPSRIRAN